MNKIQKMPYKLEEKVKLYHPCQVCGSKHGVSLGILEYAQFDHSKLVDRYDVVCCTECGFISVNTPLQQSDYDYFYKESCYSPEYLSLQMSEEERNYFEQTVNILSDICPNKDVALFDIGCGVGYLIEALRNFGFDRVYGIDLSSSCVNLLKEQKNIRCEKGSLASLPFHGQSMDMMVLSHIIEHIVDLESALKSIIAQLSENGQIYVEVPDAVRYNQFARNKPLGFFYFQHIIHFDIIHLRNLFVVNGFKEVKSGFRERIEKGFTMPCIWAAFRKDDSKKVEFDPDFSLALKIKHWFKKTSLDPYGTLLSLAKQKTGVYVWGIGVHAQMMLKMSPLRDCNIKALVDKNDQLHGKTIEGREICPVDVLKDAGKDEVVFISTFVHRENMLRSLKEDIGFEGRIIAI